MRLGHGAYKDNIDYNIFSGEWLIGRIYERNDFPDEVRFFWSLHGVVLTQPPAYTPMALQRICAKLAATVCIRLLTLGRTRWSIRYRQRSAAPLALRRSRTPLTGLSVEMIY